MGSQQQALGDVSTRVSQDVDVQLQESVDLSTVPSRRTEPVPSSAIIHSKKCPAHELVLNVFRRQRSAVMEVCLLHHAYLTLGHAGARTH
jgi:hypothetical protein